jgi:CheY-like chemotaxis protein
MSIAANWSLVSVAGGAEAMWSVPFMYQWCSFAVDEARSMGEEGMPPIHVLIVDDDPLQRMLVRLMVLRRHPTVTITEAENGQAALANYEAAGADLIITDIQMPLLDGIALTAAIRSRGDTLPIIVISSVPDGELLARQAGASRYLDKHTVSADLPQILADMLAI